MGFDQWPSKFVDEGSFLKKLEIFRKKNIVDNMIELEYNFWKVVTLRDGAEETTLFKTGVWQTKPFGAVEISEKEFNELEAKYDKS